MEISKKEIKVYNEMPSQINLIGAGREYVFPPAIDGRATMNYVSFSDIEYAHMRSIVFSSGLLRFDEAEQDEIYKALRLDNWKDTVWFQSTIEDVILNPTLEKMMRIIAIKDLIVLERIRGRVVYYNNTGERDISTKVVRIVNARYKELVANILKSKIELRAFQVENSVSSDVAEIRKENETLKNELEKMNKLLESAMDAISKMQNNGNGNNDENANDVLSNNSVSANETVAKSSGTQNVSSSKSRAKKYSSKQ